MNKNLLKLKTVIRKGQKILHGIKLQFFQNRHIK